MANIAVVVVVVVGVKWNAPYHVVVVSRTENAISVHFRFLLDHFLIPLNSFCRTVSRTHHEAHEKLMMISRRLV